jgi:phosphatidate cytidylyltransferase
MTDQNKNLLLRVVTALVLLPLVLWLIALGGVWFALLVGVAGGLAALEVNQMAAAAPVWSAPGAAPQTRPPRLGAGGIASALAAFAIPLLNYLPLQLSAWQPLTFRFLLAALALLALIDALFFELELPRAPLRVGIALLAPIYCGLTLSALGLLRELPQGAFWIVLALVVTWFNDTGGYFAGRFLGKHKMYPRISPSKTWEGAAGGALATTLGAVFVKLLWLPALPLYGAVLIGLGGSVIGPLGDLSESMLKRGFGAKDSGRTLPGHGGMLDRIDALLFVSPFVLFCARHLLSAQ